jgi:FAD:protein FMN transferase
MVGPAEAEEPGTDLTRSRPMMGTVYRITVTGAPQERAERAVRAAFDEMARLEEVLSEWRASSEISKVNAAAGERPVQVGDDTLAVVKAGLDVSRWSEGAFDMSWAALRGLYDFKAASPRPPRPNELRPRLPLVDWRQIEIDEEARTVFLTRKGMAIGTGGIGKGYALDRAGEVLRDAGIEKYMLFGGGQVQVHGRRGNRPWRVGVQHPRRQDYFAFLESTGGSISTSGDYEHFFVDGEGTRWHHILDPRTGTPARGAQAVTVLAATGLYADALSTAAFVLGADRARTMFERIPYRADLLLIDPACRVVMTPRMKSKLRFTLKLGPHDALPGCTPEGP